MMPSSPGLEQAERVPVPTRNVVLTERQREAEDASKLKALRSAARVGVGALDRGEFKEFGASEELRTHLNDLSEKVISKAAGSV